MSHTPPSVDVLDGSPGLRFVQIDYPAEHRMGLHAHEDVVSLNFCLSGGLQEFRGKETFELGPSHLSLIPAGVPHANRFLPGARTFLAALGTPWLERVRPASALSHTPLLFTSGRPVWIASRMHREFLRRDDLTPLAMEGMLLELVAEMGRESRACGERDTPRWLREVKDFLHAHFTEAVTSESVTTVAGVHPSHLMRAFRQSHGCTVGEYVRGLRVEYARHLLESSDAPLAQVALDVGFYDQGHFCRAFKSQVGVSPGEFRRHSR